MTGIEASTMMNNKVPESRHVDIARQLIKQMEAQDEEEVNRLLKQLTEMRHDKLFCELGRLTRELHETLNGFRLDSRIAYLAENDIPAAKKRLGHVIDMTENSALSTLTAVENAMPLSQAMRERTRRFKQSWQSFRRREMTAEQFRRLNRDMDEFLEHMDGDISHVHENLSEILVAQEAQDLSGQIIKQVIGLVQNLENSLVDLIRIAGEIETRTEDSPGNAVNKGGNPWFRGLKTLKTPKLLGPWFLDWITPMRCRARTRLMNCYQASVSRGSISE
jgi:chemotaxis protein CheZ